MTGLYEKFRASFNRDGGNDGHDRSWHLADVQDQQAVWLLWEAKRKFRRPTSAVGGQADSIGWAALCPQMTQSGRIDKSHTYSVQYANLRLW